MENSLLNILYALGISEPDSLKLFHPKVRDREDIAVFKCSKSGIFVLSRTDHIDQEYYIDKEDLSYWESNSREQAKLLTKEDDLRRRGQFESLIIDKKWLDIGTGAGGILDLLKDSAAETMAVEPQQAIRNALKNEGYIIFASSDEAPDKYFQVVTLFHVFEHFPRPLETLKIILKKMKPGGKIIIEVPHANDFLISFLNLESFKNFTFWSEHLILHTRNSLRIFLERVGLHNISINGFQRYSLANHLHWLAHNKPGGHKVWSQLQTPELDLAYAAMLESIDKTDTLIAIAEK